VIPPVLVVAMPLSVHSLRWLRTISGTGGRTTVLLPSMAGRHLPELESFPRIAAVEDLAHLPPGGVGLWVGPPEADEPPDDMPIPIGFESRARLVRPATIAAVVRTLRPAVLHSLEVQIAGYACLGAAEQLGPACPPWLVSSWGSDFYLYRKLGTHQPILRAVAGRMDGYLYECARDLDIVRALGFTRPVHRLIPATGGADFDGMPTLPALARTSTRRCILVKGYHTWSGRAQHILSALHLAAPMLRSYRISIVLASAAVADAARTLAETDGLDVEVVPWDPEHGTALQRIAESRMAIGLGISDGIGTSLLEAMALGAFPIAASTSCAADWLQPGTDGLIVDPHDVAALADAIRIAATDDALVDAAAIRNRATVEDRWNITHNRAAALAIYDAVIGGRA
jgi:hypothetical protein